MIPHASAIGPASAHTLGELSLPHLSQLLGSLEPSGQRLGSDEDSLNTPYELALASLRGTATAPVPTAAWLAQSHGLDASLSWALLTPLHLSVGGHLSIVASIDEGSGPAAQGFIKLPRIRPLY